MTFRTSLMLCVCFVSGLFAGAEDELQPRKVNLPLVVYEDGDDLNPPYCPSGWMGNFVALQMDGSWSNKPYSGKSCMKFTYSDVGQWVGLVWQDPPNSWGAEPGGYDISGAERLTFWARGEKGGEKIKFEMGILKENVNYPDSTKASLGCVKLSSQWKQYVICLRREDLACIKTGFAWVLGGTTEPITFYLDHIQYE